MAEIDVFYNFMDVPHFLISLPERYYDPSIGRFLQQDPIGINSGEENFYTYVENNPVINIDPLGLCILRFVTTSGQEGLIYAQTNDGKKTLGIIPVTNRAGDGGPVDPGKYEFGRVGRFGSMGKPNEEGLKPSIPDKKRTNHQMFGDAWIPVNVPGRPGIGIHARYPDPGDRLKGTVGRFRASNFNIDILADWIETNCFDSRGNAKEENTFIKE